MPELTITLLGEDFEVEYEFKITAPSYGGSGPSWNSPGEPPEPCEYELEFRALRKAGAEAPLEIPEWLKQKLLDALYESDEVYETVAESERDSYDDHYFDERD